MPRRSASAGLPTYVGGAAGLAEAQPMVVGSSSVLFFLARENRGLVVAWDVHT